LGWPVQATVRAGGKREAIQYNKSYTPPFAARETTATHPAPHWPGPFNHFFLFSIISFFLSFSFFLYSVLVFPFQFFGFPFCFTNFCIKNIRFLIFFFIILRNVHFKNHDF
jgi:hypothetical protein